MKALIIILTVPLFVITAQAKYSGGIGARNDPYQIATVEDLILLGETPEDYDKHFILTADIDLDPNLPGRKVFDKAIIAPDVNDAESGFQGTPFAGIFDGNIHVISNFIYDCNGMSYIGLFGYVDGENAQIKNLRLISPNVVARIGNLVGALVGCIEHGSIAACYVEGGRVYGNNLVGGLAGRHGPPLLHRTITNSHATAIVVGYQNVGGLVGENTGTISDCYSGGDVSGYSNVGGLVGHNNHHGDITNCDSMGNVKGDMTVGGLVGANYETIMNCYSSGSVEGNQRVGGLVGFSRHTITNCYSTGSVEGYDRVGGLVGYNYDFGSTITNCYSTGCVEGSQRTGGLVGINRRSGTIKACLWDIETSGRTNMCGSQEDDASGCDNDHGRTTAEMQDPATFMEAGWDFVGQLDGPHDVWAEPPAGGYPVLWWQLSPLPELPFSDGSGKSNDPYLISTPAELNSIGYNPRLMAAHFKLINDIDLRGIDFFIIGSEDFPFAGVFDGNEHTIFNFTYYSDAMNSIGLFGYIRGQNTQIKDLGLIDPNIDVGTGYNVGALVGYMEDGIITGCYVQGGSVLGDSLVGGLVGFCSGIITNCFATTRVTGIRWSAGGLVGGNGGTITSSYTTGMVSGYGSVGGLVGRNSDAVTNCYSASSTSGNEFVGGLVGDNYLGGTITNCYTTGNVSGGNNVGGLVGLTYWDTTISNCYSIGFVSGTEYIGGLIGIGLMRPGATVADGCFWDIETSGQTTSEGGISKTTTEMQMATTFLDAGWDFVDETANGTEDIWCMPEGDYPRLWWQYGQAFSPYPQDGAVDVPQPLTLSWLPGGSVLYHDVYFGKDKEAVANATIESSNIYRGRQEPEITTYDPGNLELVKTYYWRIDEVGGFNPESPWKGNVWNFTTANFIVVDDFESYDAGANQIWYTWHDGLGYGAPSNMGYYAGNGTGSAVGNETGVGPIMELIIVHGGRQSMPYAFDNNKQGFAKYSEAEKTLSYPRDWTQDNVSELSIWFRGYSSSTGSFIEEPAGTFTMTGSGTDIGGWSDQFHFAFKMLNGAGSIVAKVESIENTHEEAKAGVMIRDWLDSSSKHAFVYVTPSNGVAFHGRSLTSDSSFTMNRTGIIAPHWVRLERDDADNFTAYHSSDGSTWETIGEIQNIQMGTNVYVGLALTSHDSRTACEAKFTNMTITGSIHLEWADQDIGIATNGLEPMYVAISNNTGEPAVVNHNDPTAAGIDTWTEWVIPLQTFADQGIDMTDVNSIAIGFGDRKNPKPGSRGLMYFDDIRLYRPRLAASDALEVIVP